MKQRIITALIAICVLVPVLFLHDTILLPLGVAACCVIAVYEMLACLGLQKSAVLSAPLYLCGAAFPLMIRYLSDDLVKTLAFSAVAILSLYFFMVLIFSHGKYQIGQLSVLAFSLLYILIGFNAIMVIHDWEAAGGTYLYLICFIGAWVTDIFAYFCGILFGRGGKHKLIPDVSPKKTVEGSIGGVVFCILSMVLYGWVVGVITGANANLLIFAIAGLFVSVVAQIGDLSMSVIKRTYGIKDYGKLFPGHGGVLDRFDSVLAVSVVMLVITMSFDFFK